MKIKNIAMVVIACSFISSSAHAFTFRKPDVEGQLQQARAEKFLNIDEITPERVKLLLEEYKGVSSDLRVLMALETLRTTVGEFSRLAIRGANLTEKPMKVEFKNLATINPNYSQFDALGWKKGKNLYIYVNEKHRTAPYPVLAALLSHEALHQDQFNSINEETYAWTMEAAVWSQISDEFPSQTQVSCPLVTRENMLKKLFIRGNYTDKYIRKTVESNPGYANLPSRSPGFEDDL